MSNKHTDTAEAWRVFGAQAENGTSQEIRCGEKLIARVFMNGDALERESNANLMAASRDMAEALTVSLSYIDAVCLTTSNQKKLNNYADCARKIRAALTKAGAA